jgi:peptidoglycan/LPS O-acetylase OafA/YrhL
VLVVLLMVAVVYRLQLLFRGASIERLYYAPDTHADSLLVGCVVGYFFARGRLPVWIRSSARMRETASVVTLTLIIAAVCLLEYVPQRLAYETLLLPTAFAFVAGGFIACVVTGETVVARGLSVRPVTFLGRISYSLYLWHLPLLVAFSGVDREVGVPTVAAVALAVVFASCSRRFIELPFLRRRVEPPSERVATRPSPVPA